MTRAWVVLTNRFHCFWMDQKGGERDTLTTLLILALLIIPLIAVIIFFGKEISEQAEQTWKDVIGKGLPTKE